MPDLETTIRGLECCIVRKTPCGDCIYFVPNPNDEDTGWCNRDKTIRDAISLLKAQDEVIKTLRKIGYPHGYEQKEPWIVNYLNSITEVIKKAVKLSGR